MIVAGVFTGNGRIDTYFDINEAELKAIHNKATFIHGGNVKGVFTTENYPYYIDGNIIIKGNNGLKTDPGVVLAFRGPYKINIELQ